MLEDRSAVRDFVKGNKRPIVDSLSNYMELLNANSYQKGSWVLHMLRLEVGDSLFRQVIRTYYDSFKGGNATSRDFEQVASAVSGKDLAWFFEQWLYRSDIPLLKISKTVVGQNIVLRIEQKQEQLYKFRLRVEVLTPGTKGRGGVPRKTGAAIPSLLLFL